MLVWNYFMRVLMSVGIVIYKYMFKYIIYIYEIDKWKGRILEIEW